MNEKDITFPISVQISFSHIEFVGCKVCNSFQTSVIIPIHFTGIGAESVRQDFFSTLYLSWLESLLTKPAQDQLSQKDTLHPQIVNRAVSFNAIKDQALALLLLSGLETDALLERLTALFMMNPCLEWKGRNPSCSKSSDRILLDSLNLMTVA